MSTTLYEAHSDEPQWGIALGEGVRPLKIFSMGCEAGIPLMHWLKDPFPKEFHGPLFASLHNCTFDIIFPCLFGAFTWKARGQRFKLCGGKSNSFQYLARGLDSVGYVVTGNMCYEYERMLSLDSAAKVSEGSKIVLHIDGDGRVLNVLNDSSLVLFGPVMPVFSCHAFRVCFGMPPLLIGLWSYADVPRTQDTWSSATGCLH